MTFSTFQPNCTLPSAPVDYVSGVTIRSTLDIVWACVSTIIACTYTVLHLDVIADDSVTSRESRWWPDTRKALRDFAVEVTVAGVAILAPEYVLLTSWVNFPDRNRALWSQGKKLKIPADWTSTHIRYLNMGGFRLCHPISGGMSQQEERHTTYEETILDVKGMLLGMKAGEIAKKAPLSEFEISDISKANAFAKTLAMWQISWFGVNLVTRLGRDLPISQLEVGTAALLVISLPTWIFNFSKPKVVRCGTRIYLKHPDDLTCERETNVRSEMQHEPNSEVSRAEHVIGPHINPSDKDLNEFKMHLDRLNMLQNMRIKSFKREVLAQLAPCEFRDTPAGMPIFIMVTAIMALPFAAVHIAAWNATFPTSVDRWIWRTASLAMTLSALTYLVAYLIVVGLVLLDRDTDERIHTIFKPTSVLVVPLYVLARLVLMTEMIRCLINLPPETFIGTWTGNLPHLG